MQPKRIPYECDSLPRIDTLRCQRAFGAILTDLTRRAGLGAVGWLFTTFGAKFVDYDNDGWKDVVLANGRVFPQIDRYQSGITYEECSLRFHKRGDGTFEEVGLQSGPGSAQRRVRRGLATADYDNDGDLEIMI